MSHRRLFPAHCRDDNRAAANAQSLLAFTAVHHMARRSPHEAHRHSAMMLRQLRVIFSGIGHHWKTKLVCHAATGAWIAFFYYAPQRWPFLPARSAPTLAIDLMVPFQPAWAVVYQSVFIVHTLALWLPRRCAAVKHYALSIALAFACGAAIFWLWPTLGPP